MFFGSDPLYCVPRGVSIRWVSPENLNAHRGLGGQALAGRKGAAWIPLPSGAVSVLADLFSRPLAPRESDRAVPRLRDPARRRGDRPVLGRQPGRARRARALRSFLVGEGELKIYLDRPISGLPRLAPVGERIVGQAD